MCLRARKRLAAYPSLVVVVVISQATEILQSLFLLLEGGNCVSTTTRMRFPKYVLDSKDKRGRMHAGAKDIRQARFQVVPGRSDHARAYPASWQQLRRTLAKWK
jgi:hypothetical protein